MAESYLKQAGERRISNSWRLLNLNGLVFRLEKVVIPFRRGSVYALFLPAKEKTPLDPDVLIIERQIIRTYEAGLCASEGF
jgi:hypothetical protein